MPRDIKITPHLGSTGSGLYPEIKFRGISQSFITLKVDDDGSLKYTGTYGTLFNITDSKDGLLHSVNDISGLPILSVYSYDFVQMGKWDKYALVVNSDKVGVGLTGPTNKFHIYDTSGLGAFRLQDGTEASGYVLRSDANGVGTWQPGGIISSGTVQLTNGQAVVSTTNVTVGSKIFLTYAGDSGSGWTFSSAPNNTMTTFTDTIIANTSFQIEAVDASGLNDTTNQAWVHWMII
jgi:hypothetical protein